MKFGENLKRIRKEKKISQEELAENLGVSRQSVSKWETGENYPSMNNIMMLCDLFKCKMNDLVREDLKDIDVLEERKLNVVKFQKEKQNKMKGISKTVYILSRIGKIAAILGFISLLFVMIVTPIFLSFIKIKENKVEILGEEIQYKIETNGIRITYSGKEEFIKQNEYANGMHFIENLKENHHITIFFLEVAFFFLAINLILLFLALSSLEKLFVNIHDKDTPFSLENVNYIKKIAIFMILIIIIPNIAGSIVSFITGFPLGIGFELMDLIYILVLFGIAYIFEYGYFIQLDSNGKMYGDINE